MDGIKFKRSAYHEAGHAVIGFRFGCNYADINIIPEKKRDGVFRPWSGLNDFILEEKF